MTTTSRSEPPPSPRPFCTRDRSIAIIQSDHAAIIQTDSQHEVITLRFADIDWSAATIRVIGKGHREAWLPLPQAVGDAILAYVEHARPKIADPHVILTARAPWSAIGGNATIAFIVKRAIGRAGVEAPSFGSHLLRHSAATSMLRDGASLDGIASILRHRSIDTTVVYTRVDQNLLGSVAQPWTTATPQL